MIRFKCLNCQAEYEVADDLRGAKVACETCKTRFYVPEEGHEAKLVPPKNMKEKAENEPTESTPQTQAKETGTEPSQQVDKYNGKRQDSCGPAEHIAATGSIQEKTVEETISSSEDNSCNGGIENSLKDDSSRLKKIILTHQENLLKKYHSLIECSIPLFQFLKTATVENLSLNNLTELEPLDLFLQNREQILCLEHDIWASEFMLAALECKIVCPKCKSSNTSIAWAQWFSNSGGRTEVFCLKCFTWHEQPEKLFNVVKDIYQKRTSIFVPLKEKIRNVWKFKKEDWSHNNYWQTEFKTLWEYDKFPNRVKDMWFCEPEKFLDAIDLFNKSSSDIISTPDRRKKFLRQLGVEEPSIFAPLIPLWEKHIVGISIGAVILFFVLIVFWKITLIVLLFTVLSALLSLVVIIPCSAAMPDMNGKTLAIIAVIAFFLAFLFLCAQVFPLEERSDGEKIHDTYKYLNKGGKDMRFSPR